LIVVRIIVAVAIAVAYVVIVVVIAIVVEVPLIFQTNEKVNLPICSEQTKRTRHRKWWDEQAQIGGSGAWEAWAAGEGMVDGAHGQRHGAEPTHHNLREPTRHRHDVRRADTVQCCRHGLCRVGDMALTCRHVCHFLGKKSPTRRRHYQPSQMGNSFKLTNDVVGKILEYYEDKCSRRYTSFV
jgi:hypothetical protein